MLNPLVRSVFLAALTLICTACETVGQQYGQLTACLDEEGDYYNVSVTSFEPCSGLDQRVEFVGEFVNDVITPLEFIDTPISIDHQIENPNPKAMLWVVPYWGTTFTDASGFRSASSLMFINPGLEQVTVKCFHFNFEGSHIHESTQSRMLDAGEQWACRNNGVGSWGIVASDGPILPSIGAYWSFKSDYASSKQSESYPIDCRFPEGYEFVCQFAAGGSHWQ